MAGYVTSSVVVSTTIRDAVVWYTIHPSENDRQELKTVRFSELNTLHRQLTKEVRWFPGRLPKKTLRRRTTADFVESRRAAIEFYLRTAAAHKLANTSVAWTEFFSGSDVFASVPSDLPSEAPPPLALSPEVVEAAEVPKEEPSEACPLSMRSDVGAAGGSDDEADCVSSSLTAERDDALLAKRSQLKSAIAAKQELERKLSSGGQAIDHAETEAHTAAALETEAAARLRSHQLSLESLEATRAAKKVQSSEKHRKQTELAKGYERKLAATFDSVKKAQSQLDNARRECIESEAAAHSKFQAAAANKLSAEAADNGARNAHLAMVVNMNALQEKGDSFAAEAQSAERELDACKFARAALISECTDAETQCRKAESEALAADTAIASHVSDSARRDRAHEVEVRRAEEKAMNSAALRDMQTRCLLVGRDRQMHQTAQNEATAAAEADIELVAKAKAAHAETTSNDASALAALKAVAMNAAKNMTKRNTIAAALASRVTDSDVTVHTASAKHASAVASCKTLQAEVEIVEARVAVLDKSLPEHTAKVAAATANLAAVKAQGDEDQAPLRCAAQAAAQWLQVCEKELDSHIQALDEVNMAVAEAHEEAVEPSEDTDVQGPDFDFLQQSSAARCADHEKSAQDSARACEAAAAAVEAARRNLVAVTPSCEEGYLCPPHSQFSAVSAYTEFSAASEDSCGFGRDAYDEFYEQRTALETVLKHLEHVLQKKEEANKAASAALAAAKQELQAIAEKKEAAPRKVKPIAGLVREELAIVDAGLKIHQEEGSRILEAAKTKASDWSREKEALSADIHRAQLQVHMAEQDVVATKEVTKTLKAAEKAAKTKLKSQRLVTVKVAQTLKATENAAKQSWAGALMSNNCVVP